MSVLSSRPSSLKKLDNGKIGLVMSVHKQRGRRPSASMVSYTVQKFPVKSRRAIRTVQVPPNQVHKHLSRPTCPSALMSILRPNRSLSTATFLLTSADAPSQGMFGKHGLGCRNSSSLVCVAIADPLAHLYRRGHTHQDTNAYVQINTRKPARV